MMEFAELGFCFDSGQGSSKLAGSQSIFSAIIDFSTLVSPYRAPAAANPFDFVVAPQGRKVMV